MLQRPIGAIISIIDRVKEFYIKVTAAPINKEEEENNFELACRFMHIMHVLWTADYRFLIKTSKTLTALIITTLTSFFVFSGYLYYAIFLLKGAIVFDTGECLYVIMHFSLLMVCFIFRPLLIFIFMDELTSFGTCVATFKEKFNAIHFMCEEIIICDESNINASSIPVKNTFQRDNILRILISMFVLGFLSFSLFVLLRPLDCIFEGQNCTPNVQDYFVLFPFYDHVKSIALYYVLSSIGSIIGLYVVASTYPCMIFLLTLFCIMKHHALHVSERMQTLSQNFISQFEKSLLLERRGYDQRDSKNMLFSAFGKDLLQLLQTRQEFLIFSRKVETFMIVHQTIVVSCCGTVMLGVVAHMIMVKMGTVQMMTYITMTITLTVTLLMCCYMGKTFGDMGEVYRYAVYNLPWYYLPPESRKIVNIFQSMEFNHPELKILRVYPVNMALFPRLWSSVFSYANILRTVSNR